MEYCIKCGKEITSDERGIYKKLVDRCAVEFLCKSCLAAHFGCGEALLDKKIEQFRNNGCVLFVRKNRE